MRRQFLVGTALAALALPAAAHAQSAASTEFDNEDIVVTGTRNLPPPSIGGVEISDTSKAKGQLDPAFIARQTPGQTILDTINQLPGVSFQNNDPFGSSGGTLTIRGFDASRIALTIDGIPLNDTGNYAIYSNQQLDPELIEAVSVNYGSTDVDSPTASATGSTVNYRTIVPTDDFHVRFVGSGGDYEFMRVFGLVNTGVFTSFGTKAWFSASRATNNWFANDFGRISKQQYNGRIYQPLGSNGDFLSLAANWNVNRNNFAGSLPLTLYSSTPGAGVGSGSFNRFPTSNDELPYHVARCIEPLGTAGVADAAGSCGTAYDYRYNPSNTGTLRAQSRFTLADGLVLTIEPSFSYTKANGGGTVAAREYPMNVGTGGATACAKAPAPAGAICETGYFGGYPYVGADLNGDGDTLDQVLMLAPSQTQTNRYIVIANLRWDIAKGQTVRIGYTFDRGRHRQTGEVGYLLANGEGADPFPVNNPVLAANGTPLEKRNRLSYAMLNQFSGQYRGVFGPVTIDAGFRMAFQERDLNNYCFTSSSGGFVECAGDAATNTLLSNLHVGGYDPVTGFPISPTSAAAWAPPQSRVYHYDRFLPSAGLTWKIVPHLTSFLSYSKGIQVPGTDNLYNAFYFAPGSSAAHPVAETSDNFDAGLRYASRTFQAEVGPWYTRFNNRLSAAYDPETQVTTYRNLGRVDKYGIDADFDWQPIPQLLVHAFGSYLWSDIKNDVQTGTVGGVPVYAATAGKRESGMPVYTFGGRVQGSLGPLDLGVQAKRTGPRYINDVNLPLIAATTTAGYTAGTVLYPAKTPAYTVVDLDARLNLEFLGLNKQTWLQFNIQNLFNQYYVGGFSGGTISNSSIPYTQVGLPRTFIATINLGF